MLSSYLLLCLYTSWSTRISRRELHERYILKKKIHPHSCFMPSSYLLLCLHTSWSSITSRSRSGDVVHLVRASDRHAADAGSIPRCGKGFFSHGQLSVQTVLRVSVHPPCAIACINVCAHVKDPVVHVRFRWILETHKHRRLGSATLSQLAFPGKSNPNFPCEKSIGTIQL